MKILYITLENLSLHKGSVVHIKEVIDGLQKRGHQVGLIASASSKNKNVYHFYNIHPMTLFLLNFIDFKKKLYFISSLLLFLRLFKIIRHYDIIYARDFHTVIIALIPRLIFKKKLVFEINGIANEEQRLKGDRIVNRVFAFLIRKAENIATKCSDRIISVTPQIETYLAQHFGCPQNKIEVVGNGVNTKIFRPIHDEGLLLDWKKRLGIMEEVAVIAFVGNLALWQGVNVLIDSAVTLLSKESKLKFLIVGEGVQKTVLVKKVLNSGFNGSFIFTGMVDYRDIPILINIADICVAPFILKRNQETGVSPLKVFEYMACGKPVIASRIEGLEFIGTEGVGYLTEPGDTTSLEAAMHVLLHHDEKRVSMGQKGLKIASERFSWEYKVAEIQRIMEQLA